MQHVYSRSSTASQSLLRQRHILTEAGLLARVGDVTGGFRPADGVWRYEDPATASEIPVLQRPAFGKVTAAAHPGDALAVSELFRLCRDLSDIQAVPGLVPGPRRGARGRPPAPTGAPAEQARAAYLN